MKKIIFFSALLLLVALTSCLKDKGFTNHKTGFNANNGERFVTILNAYETNGINTLGTFTTPVEEPVDYFTVGITGPVSSKAIQVTLAVDPALVANENNVNHTSYLDLPAAAYDLPLTVTIPAGKEYVAVPLKLKKAPLDPVKTYALGIKITGVNDPSVKIAANTRQSLLGLLIKNKYDGNYGLRIKTVGWGAYGISDNQPGEWPSKADGRCIGMVTVGTSSVKLFDYAYGEDFYQPAFTTNNATTTVFGATEPRFNFDPVTNQLTGVVNTAPPDSRNRQFRLNPAVGNSRWVDSSNGRRYIFAAYILSQDGRPDLFIYDTLTYKNARP